MPEFSNVHELIADYIKDEIISMNNATCEKCNECCSMTTILTHEEFNALKRFIKKDKRGKFFYERGIALFMEHLAMGTIYWMCPFSWNQRCSIYNRRPMICREFHCDNPVHSKEVRSTYEVAHSHSMADLFKIKEILQENRKK